MKGLLVSVAVMVAACNQAKVEITCTGNGEAIDCALNRQGGNDPLVVTWDYAMSCANGTKAIAHGKESMDSTQLQATHIFRDNDFANADKCDEVKSIAVNNIVVRAK